MEMETGLRWVLILVSVIVLALIVFDGWRRIKHQQKTHKRSRGADFLDDNVDELLAVAGDEGLT